MWSLIYPQLWFTYGPNTKDDDVLRDIFQSGATGVRLTFSYGTPDIHLSRARQIRKIGATLGIHPIIVADLQGEKCRFAKIEGHDEIPVKQGVPFELTRDVADPLGNPQKFPLQVPSYLDNLQSGDTIIEGDGALIIHVRDCDTKKATCVVTTDGYVHPGRGLLFQKSGFAPTSMTEKDYSDLEEIIDSELFDAIAISFVGSAKTIQDVRKKLVTKKSSLGVIAKIETHLGVEHVEAIAKQSDAIIAARGDLALTLPWIELPEAMIKICNTTQAEGCPLILATQIMEGLERFAMPTRAEICDLARWMTDGAAGAMLSYETAFGANPVIAVKAASSLIDRYKRTG